MQNVIPISVKKVWVVFMIEFLPGNQEKPNVSEVEHIWLASWISGRLINSRR
jgi:hypothetical protein